VSSLRPSPRARPALRLGALEGADLRWALLSAASVVVASVAGQLASREAITGWYRTIVKPVYTPPNWVFPVAWTLLFTMMGVSFWRILRRPSGTPHRRTGTLLFFAQLALNAAWSAAFFGAHSPLLGLVVIVPFWAVILATTLVFRTMDRLAAWLLVPYLAWVAFATLLDFAIWRMN
jgi:tryptophan-rich sensory protein